MGDAAPSGARNVSSPLRHCGESETTEARPSQSVSFRCFETRRSSLAVICSRTFVGRSPRRDLSWSSAHDVLRARRTWQRNIRSTSSSAPGNCGMGSSRDAVSRSSRSSMVTPTSPTRSELHPSNAPISNRSRRAGRPTNRHRKRCGPTSAYRTMRRGGRRLRPTAPGSNQMRSCRRSRLWSAYTHTPERIETARLRIIAGHSRSDSG